LRGAQPPETSLACPVVQVTSPGERDAAWGSLGAPGRRSVLFKLLRAVSHRSGHVIRPSLLPVLRKDGQAATLALWEPSRTSRVPPIWEV
jgi:hypothetical protein